MKILHVSPTYYPQVGGVSTHVKNICEGLSKKHNITVFTTDPSGKLPEEEGINGVKVKRFKALAPNEAYYFSTKMIKELRKSKFDIVHGHNYHAFPLLFSMLAKRSRFIVTTRYHGFGHTTIRNILLRLYKPIGKRILKDCDKIICLSDYERRLLISHFQIEKEKIVIIPNGISEKEFKNLKKNKKGSNKRILCVARLEKYKGINYLIEILRKLPAEIRLEIVGEGPYGKELARLTDKLGLRNRVNFHRCLPRKRLLGMYANADLFVLLSKYEAFNNSVAEALASKTPCIVANTSALKEWVDNANCFGIDYPIDAEELAMLIQKVIGKEVKEVKLPDWDDIVRKLERIYRSGTRDARA